jgi:DNA (cytosine-5)-methyltransferase 1
MITMKTLTAVDLFAGAGGATTGLVQAGFDVMAAVENDMDAVRSYRANHPAVKVVESDIRSVDAQDLRRSLGMRSGSLSLLKACPPCQGFSSLANGNIDEARNDLVLDVGRFVREFRPKSVLLENVPGLAKDARLRKLLAELATFGYKFEKYLVDASDLGVPQRRKRLIVVAVSSSVRRQLPDGISKLIPGFSSMQRMTVREAFRSVRQNANPNDNLSKYRQSNATVRARIAAVPRNGGSRFDLPLEHRLPCHNKLDGRRATASYGRIKWDEPSPTMTTRCTTPACGTFIHPEEHRGLTLREAALLQTFPADYTILGSYESVERQIGNAVPVRMAKVLGLAVRNLIVARAERVDYIGE